jgi:hypothetical protein
VKLRADAEAYSGTAKQQHSHEQHFELISSEALAALEVYCQNINDSVRRRRKQEQKQAPATTTTAAATATALSTTTPATSTASSKKRTKLATQNDAEKFMSPTEMEEMARLQVEFGNGTLTDSSESEDEDFEPNKKDFDEIAEDFHSEDDENENGGDEEEDDDDDGDDSGEHDVPSEEE